MSKPNLKPRLFPEHFKIGKISGSPREFPKGKISKPRGGEDLLEYWYSTDPEESEYLDEDFQENIDKKIEYLKKDGWNPEKQYFIATTQSHLDLGWRWRYIQGVAKAEKTFSKVHGHFKLFPSFTFTGSQPAMYEWVKWNSPEIFDMVREDVASGRHELQGGSWCEGDGRMPSGEAWVRQRLYGQLFYAREFGKLAEISWFPDSFGYADNLPQIFVKSGAWGFMTAKLVSNHETKWPFWAWVWRSQDGSELLSYLCGNHGKLGPLGGYHVHITGSPIPESYQKSYRLLKQGNQLEINYEQNEPENDPSVSDEELPFIGCFFGEGDGGHGPQGMETAVYRAFAERGHVQWASTKEIYDKINEYRDRLPVWKEELYYEYHRGSLTTQTAMKRMNRYFEWNLPIYESLLTLIKMMNPSKIFHPKDYLNQDLDQIPTCDNVIEQLWHNVCLMQFHDVLPGTSLPEVYDECFEFWHQDLNVLAKLRSEIKEELGKNISILQLLFNSKHPIFPNSRFSIPNEILIELNKLLGNNSTEISDIFLDFQTYIIPNLTSSHNSEIIEIPVCELVDFIPLAVWHSTFNRFSPVQLLKADSLGFELDRKPDRLIFPKDQKEWSLSSVKVLGICINAPTNQKLSINTYMVVSKVLAYILPVLQKEVKEYFIEPSFISERSSEHMIIYGLDELSISIDKESGNLIQITINNQDLLKAPAGLASYLDNPEREPCWNLMPHWWEHPLTHETNKENVKISVIDNGPIQWTIRVHQQVSANTKGFVDYILIKDRPGIGINIGLDFHETNHLVKYQLPLKIMGEYSIAETNYSTQKRANNPVANHDVPRWEKWMHTFVTFETADNNSARDPNIKELLKIALINEGKYGFDTIENKLGISIVHGPEYPNVDVVSWIREERKSRLENNLGAPPSIADQGECLTRLWILPYDNSWHKGHISNFAHSFNRDQQKIITPIGLRNKEPILEKNWNEIMESQFIQAQKMQNNEFQIMNSSNSAVEITILKTHETLPVFMENHIEDPDANPIIIRLVNNSSEPKSTSLYLNPILFGDEVQIIETDLLERELTESIRQKFASGLELHFKSHEIRTFKIISV